MANKTEVRSLSASLRSSDDGKFEISGVAAAYNVLSGDLGGFREVISPSAFTRCLRENADVRCFLNHDSSKICGRTASGTLSLRSTSKGLEFTCRLDPNQQWHSDLRSSIKRGDLSACSFGFTVPPGGDSFDVATDEKGQRFNRRMLKDVNIMEISITAFPAYPDGTSVSARSAANYAFPDGPALDAYHRRRAAEIEAEILRNALGFHITSDLRVLPMTQAEVDQRTDARNRIRAAEIAQEIIREQAQAEIEAAKKELGD